MLDEKRLSLLNAKTKILKALAHPTRLFIIEELSQEEKCVCYFKDHIQADFSTISKHLSVLKQAGLVEDRKQGLQVFYKLKTPCILNFMECVENAIKINIEEQKALL